MTAPTLTDAARHALTALRSRDLTMTGGKTILDRDRVNSRVGHRLIDAKLADLNQHGLLVITDAGRALVDHPIRTDTPKPAGQGRAAGMIGTTDTAVRMLPVDELHPAEDNPRQSLGDPDRLADLAESIRTQGLIQPIVACARPAGGWTIIAGHRRHAAARLGGVDQLPVIVRDLDDAGRRAAMLVENLHRSDLEPLEEARGFQQLCDLGWSQTRIAEQVGVNQATVSRRLRLLGLAEPVQEALADRQITAETAAVFARLPVDEQAKVLTGLPAGADDHLCRARASRRVEEARQANARAKAAAQLEADGIRRVGDLDRAPWDAWGQRDFDALQQIEVDEAAHAGMDCHAALVLQTGEVVLGCTNRHVHLDPTDRDAELIAQRARTRKLTAHLEAIDEHVRQQLAEHVAGLVEAAQQTSWTPDVPLLTFTATIAGLNVRGYYGPSSKGPADLLGTSGMEAAEAVDAGELHPIVLAYVDALGHGAQVMRQRFWDLATHREGIDDPPAPLSWTGRLYLDELDRIGIDHADLTAVPAIAA